MTTHLTAIFKSSSAPKEGVVLQGKKVEIQRKREKKRRSGQWSHGSQESRSISVEN